VWNAAADRLLGWRAPDALGRTLSDLNLGQLDDIGDDVERDISGGGFERELLLRREDGHFVGALAHVSRLTRAPSGGGVVFVLSDLTQRLGAEMQMRATQQQMQVLLEHSADMVALVDPAGRITFVNDAISRHAHYRNDELVGHAAIEFVHADDEARVRAALADVVKGRDSGDAPLTFRFRTRNGDYLWLEGRAVNLLNERTVGAVLVALHNVSQRVAIETQLAHRATHDALTGLPNRSLFLDRLNQLLEHARRHGLLAAVFFWDVDQFKTVNDRAGHAVGDTLLVEVARRAHGVMRAEDTVARLGGDEFVACAEVSDEAQVCALAERLREALVVDVTLPDDRQVQVSSSIGAVFGVDAAPVDIVAEADAAMYAAKRSGGGGIAVVSLAARAILSDHPEERDV
jgi:diguanylate cyclase (GGDEF)-like protein/PAS domain S-box-containing protein